MKKVSRTWNTRCQLHDATWKLAFESSHVNDKRGGVVEASSARDKENKGRGHGVTWEQSNFTAFFSPSIILLGGWALWSPEETLESYVFPVRGLSVWRISGYSASEWSAFGSRSRGSIISIREQSESANLFLTPPPPPSHLEFHSCWLTRHVSRCYKHTHHHSDTMEKHNNDSICRRMHLLTFDFGLTSPTTNTLWLRCSLRNWLLLPLPSAAYHAKLMRTHQHKCLNNQKICLCLCTCCGSSCINRPRDKFSLAL